VGRVVVGPVDEVDVYVDDDAIQTGTTGTLIDNTARTWYDGLSYARVETAPTGVTTESGPHLPGEMLLSQNYPNPFNPTTVVSCQWPVASSVNLVVYDVLGREVARLANGLYAAGQHSFTFSVGTMATGVYLVRLEARPTDGSRVFVGMKKMLLVK